MIVIIIIVISSSSSSSSRSSNSSSSSSSSNDKLREGKLGEGGVPFDKLAKLRSILLLSLYIIKNYMLYCMCIIL